MCISNSTWHESATLVRELLDQDSLCLDRASMAIDFLKVYEDRKKKMNFCLPIPTELGEVYERFRSPVHDALSNGYSTSNFLRSSHFALTTLLGAYEDYTNPYLMAVVGELNPSTILDIGCGSGQNIVSFAEKNETVVCFGVDADNVRVEQARAAAAFRNVGERCFFSHGEFRVGIEIALPRPPDVVLFSSVLNDFPGGKHGVSRILKTTNNLYPDALIVVGDFFGVSWSQGIYDEVFDLTYLHDLHELLGGSDKLTFQDRDWNQVFSDTGLVRDNFWTWSSFGYTHFVAVLQKKS